jgi:hypothetical protein
MGAGFPKAKAAGGEDIGRRLRDLSASSPNFRRSC